MRPKISGPPPPKRSRQLVREQPKSLPVQMLWIRWLIRDKQKIEARKALAATIAANPKSSEPLMVSAGLDFNEGQLASARQYPEEPDQVGSPEH